MGSGCEQGEGVDEGRGALGGFEGLEHGAKAQGLLGGYAEGLFFRGTDCQGDLGAPKAVWRCWSASHGVVVGNRGEVGAVPEQRPGRIWGLSRRSDGVLNGVRWVLETARRGVEEQERGGIGNTGQELE